MPNVEDVNRLGGFKIAHDRLAIIDGEGKSFIPEFSACVHRFSS
jgi:hypothetical protein